MSLFRGILEPITPLPGAAAPDVDGAWSAGIRQKVSNPPHAPEPTPEVSINTVATIDRGFARHVRLYDRGGNYVRLISGEDAWRMVGSGEVETSGRRRGRRIRAVRWVWIEADDPKDKDYVVRRRGYGDSHCRETPENPRGVWTIDRVRREHRRLFTRVVEDCCRRAA